MKLIKFFGLLFSIMVLMVSTTAFAACYSSIIKINLMDLYEVEDRTLVGVASKMNIVINNYVDGEVHGEPEGMQWAQCSWKEGLKEEAALKKLTSVIL